MVPFSFPKQVTAERGTMSRLRFRFFAMFCLIVFSLSLYISLLKKKKNHSLDNTTENIEALSNSFHTQSEVMREVLS